MAVKSVKKSVAKKQLKTASQPGTIVKAISSKQTKTQILQAIAELSELSVKQVKAVLVNTGKLLNAHMVKKGSGEFVVPEIAIKVIRKTRPATKAREGRNPLTGETLQIAAKPKHEVIRIRALKALKETLVTA